MEVFPDSGFRPWRPIPRTMCFTFASGCSADLLMSLSFIRRTRDQSVLDVLEEDSRRIDVLRSHRVYTSKQQPSAAEISLLHVRILQERRAGAGEADAALLHYVGTVGE